METCLLPLSILSPNTRAKAASFLRLLASSTSTDPPLSRRLANTNGEREGLLLYFDVGTYI